MRTGKCYQKRDAKLSHLPQNVKKRTTRHFQQFCPLNAKGQVPLSRFRQSAELSVPGHWAPAMHQPGSSPRPECRKAEQHRTHRYRFIGGTTASPRPALNVSREGINYILFARTPGLPERRGALGGLATGITHFRTPAETGAGGNYTIKNAHPDGKAAVIKTDHRVGPGTAPCGTPTRGVLVCGSCKI